MNNYLVHHGILGQKWGKKNGPPYPLDYKDLSKEERAEAKRSAIERGDIKEAGNNIKFYTSQEIDQVIARFNKEQDLVKLNAAHVKSGKDKVKQFSENMNLMSSTIDNTSKAYNSVAKVCNSLFGASLPLISENSKSKGSVKRKFDSKGTLLTTEKTFTKNGIDYTDTTDHTKKTETYNTSYNKNGEKVKETRNYVDKHGNKHTDNHTYIKEDNNSKQFDFDSLPDEEKEKIYKFVKNKDED